MLRLNYRTIPVSGAILTEAIEQRVSISEYALLVEALFRPSTNVETIEPVLAAHIGTACVQNFIWERIRGYMEMFLVKAVATMGRERVTGTCRADDQRCPCRTPELVVGAGPRPKLVVIRPQDDRSDRLRSGPSRLLACVFASVADPGAAGSRSRRAASLCARDLTGLVLRPIRKSDASAISVPLLTALCHRLPEPGAATATS